MPSSSNNVPQPCTRATCRGHSPGGRGARRPRRLRGPLAAARSVGPGSDRPARPCRSGADLAAGIQQAATPADKTRLFERTSLGCRHLQFYPTLLELARTHLLHVRSAQERAACLLVAGEALFHLQRYKKPATSVSNLHASRRGRVLHACRSLASLGPLLSGGARLAAAAEAFRQSIALILGMSLNRRAPHSPEIDAQLHHLCNTARFYDRIIHLVYHRRSRPCRLYRRCSLP